MILMHPCSIIRMSKWQLREAAFGQMSEGRYELNTLHQAYTAIAMSFSQRLCYKIVRT